MSALTTHGVRKFLKNGTLPKGSRNISRRAAELRETLEGAVLGLRNKIGPLEETLIQSACRHEIIFRLLLKYLSDEPNLTIENKIAILGRMQASATARDKPISDLKIEDDGKTLDGIVYDTEKTTPKAIANA